MEEITQRQQYELAFHLLSSFTEAETEEKRHEIEKLISAEGGLVSRYGEIKKMRLAYPIKKEKFSNFGYIEFFAPKAAVEKINKNLMLNDDILRHLVIKKEKERVQKPVIRIAKPKIEKPAEEKPFTESPKETEELDKKIEEILEKL
ncbi:MAG: 30S ribosomal protein S6 [Parcubacteria group bacterium]|nr:30S ribosomal protein S6 [Parcubacteria group bacterium]